MSREPFKTLVDRQAAALMAAIETRAERECTDIVAQAKSDSLKLVAHAHAHARQRFADGAKALRQTHDSRVSQARSAHETTQRQNRQRAIAALIDQAWPKLRTALETRWQNAQARAGWIAATLELAQQRLATEAWQVTCPPENAAEIETAAAHLAITQPAIIPSGDLVAGLRIEAEGVVLDATPAALLAQRSRVAAALVAELDRLAQSPPDHLAAAAC